MLENVYSGRNGVIQRQNEEIVFIVASLYQLAKDKVPFLFTNKHAYTPGTDFLNDLDQLDRIDWRILRARDFRRDMNDPEKFERYQAEALVHSVLPTASVMGLACYGEPATARIRSLVDELKLDLHVARRPGWYFP